MPTVRSLESKDQVTVITWGKHQPMSNAFYEQYNDEAWVYITNEELQSDSTGLHGFDIQKLNSYLTALHG